MPLQNRVLPSGEIVSDPARGMFMGNRGRLHDERRRLVRQRCGQRFWIICETAFKGRTREVMAPRSYTELFFLDEAVAMAAGHRPCAECRRAAFNAFNVAFGTAKGIDRVRAADVDTVLAGERRWSRGGGVRWNAAPATLPDGCFVDMPGGGFGLWNDGRLRPFRMSGYDTPVEIDPREVLPVVTPPSTVDALRNGYRPVMHLTAYS